MRAAIALGMVMGLFALALFCGAVVLLVLLIPALQQPEPPYPIPVPYPVPVPGPYRPVPRPCPGPGPCPRPHEDVEPVAAITFGGPVGPGGQQVQCDLPVSLRTKNVGGRDGAGLCVFSSIGHAARYQAEQKLRDFQAKMRAEPGGGYPEKVDRMIEKYGPGTRYLQYEGTDPTILELALKTGRMPSITYCGLCPHYSGQRVAHMTNLVYLDKDSACVLDNNFVGENDLVWMSRAEFLRRWTGGRQGWAVILLSDAPPPPPKNGQ